MARNRDPLFLVAALLVHAAGLLSAGALARVTSRLDLSFAAPLELAEAGTNGARHTLEIDLLPDEPATLPTSAPAAPVDAAAATLKPAGRLAYADPRSRERPPAHALPEPDPRASPAPATRSPAPDPGWLPNDEPERAPGLNGPPVWAIPGVLTAPSAAGPLVPRAQKAPPAPSAKNQNPADEQKKAALFPGAGTLASAVGEEVASSSAPLTSESHFKLTLDAQGRLVSAIFLSANEGDRATWERIARAVSKRFAGKSIPLPGDFAGGGEVYVSVSSKVTMPDGTANGTPAPRGLLEKAPDNEYGRIDSPLNDRFRSPMKSTAPSPNTIMVGVPFKFDISNAGASRRRVVRAQARAVPLPVAAP